MPGLDVVGAGNRRQPEEDEHKNFAQAMISQGIRPAGVSQRRKDRQCADHQRRPADLKNQIQAAQGRQTENNRHAGDDFPFCQQTGLSHTGGADAFVRISAFFEVKIIIGDIGADLQQQSHGQRR